MSPALRREVTTVVRGATVVGVRIKLQMCGAEKLWNDKTKLLWALTIDREFDWSFAKGVLKAIVLLKK